MIDIMKQTATLLFIFFSISITVAQGGFIKSYDFYEEKGFGFHHLLLKEDTLITVGTFSNPDAPQWGLFFGKLDTLGNILEYKTHFDSIGYNYVFTDGAKMIATSDGGYALIGANFDLAHLMLFKLDVNGEKEFFRSYPDETTFQDWHRDIVEFEHGYIYVGAKQQMDDGLNDAFAMRLDREGNVVWEIAYGETDLSESIGSIVRKNDNEFLLFGGQGITTYTVNPNPNAAGVNFEMTIDSLGNILSIVETEEFLMTEGLGKMFRGMQFDEEGNSVSLSRVSHVEEVLGEPTLLAQPALIGWDEDYNIEWFTTFRDASNTAGANRFNALTATPDGGWAAVGSYSEITDWAAYEGYRAGLIAKVSSEGDSLWCRTDTLFSPAYGSRPKLESVIALPSGSIVACGQVDRYNPEPAKSLGWLIKVDKYGCLEPGCNPISSLVMTSPIIDFSISPNPTEGPLRIEGEGKFDVTVFDLAGRKYREADDLREQGELNIADLPSGLYFVEIKQGAHSLIKKIVKQ